MKIYRLEQKTWNNGQMGDFNLPVTRGHYLKLESAQAKMNSEIAARQNVSDEDGYLTEEDFVIFTIEVKE